MSTLHLLKRATQTAFLASAAYTSAIWYASNHPEFEKYVPLSHTVIDYLEEREYQAQAAIRARKIGDEETRRLNDSFFYRKVSPEQALFSAQDNFVAATAEIPAPSENVVLEPSNTSQITSAINPSSSISALTSRRDHEFTEEDLQKGTTTFNDATTSESVTDPLAGRKFFDAVSGTVGSKREYLPLVLLPDERDQDINKVAMSLNSLIANINNTVVTKESVVSVTDTLKELANKKEESMPQYSNALLEKSKTFDSIYQSFNEAQDKQANSGKNTVASDNADPRECEYFNKLSKEITNTEMLLVKLINSNEDLEPVNEMELVSLETKNSQNSPNVSEKSKDQTYSSVFSKISSLHNLSLKPSATHKPTSKTNTSGIPPSVYGGLEPSDLPLKLELALAMLVNALNQHSSIPLGPYITKVREALKTQTTLQSVNSNTSVSSASTGAKDDYKNFITEALNQLSVPKDVDLKSIVDDILAN